jgi:hypothetical protein
MFISKENEKVKSKIWIIKKKDIHSYKNYIT